MLSIKNTLIAGAVAFAVGYIAGYATRDDCLCCFNLSQN